MRKGGKVILILLFVFFSCSLTVFGQDLGNKYEPTNEELYKMILKLQATIEHLKKEAQAARAEAAAAKAELRRLKQALKNSKGAHEVENIAAIKRKKFEIGTAPSSTVLRVPDNSGGVFAKAEVLYLKPMVDKLGYALSSPDSPGDPGTKLKVVDPDFDPGVRVGIGYKLPGRGLDVAMKYSYFSTRQSESKTAPTGGSLYVPNLHADWGEMAAERAWGKYSLDYNVVDFEVGQGFTVGSKIDLRLFGGLRYADISHSLKNKYTGQDFGTNVGKVKTESDFYGIGPRVGIEASWHLFQGFAVSAGVGTSLLVGNFDIGYQYDEEGDGVPEVDADADLNAQFVPVVEANLGIGWKGNVMRGIDLGLQLGWQFENWFDGYGELRFPDDVDEAHTIVNRADLGLTGPYMRVEVKF